jgi:molybdopterin-containing oxidoreductase family iron-sulfur binding subunit
MKEEHVEGNRYGMVIDLDKCTGCGTCMVACASENNLAVRPDESDKQRSITWMRLYKITNGKPFPHTEVSYIPRPCMHCHYHTPCVSVCPATATETDYHTGLVAQIYTRCIGCRYCIAACPYHARVFSWWDGYFPKGKGLERYLSPEVSPRMRGVVEKCTFCHHRLMRAKTLVYAEERELEESDYITACSEACPAQAITFGDLNDPEHQVSELSKSPYAFRLLERLGTDPSVYYLSSKDWVRKMGDNYLPGEYKPLTKVTG